MCSEKMFGVMQKHNTHFLAFFKNPVFRELVDSESMGAVIMKRRIAWLLQHFVDDVSGDPEFREHVYKVLTKLLQDKDVAIRITSAQTLRFLVDTAAFDPKQFAPFLGSLTESLLRLISDLTTLEARHDVLGTIGVIAERLKAHVMPITPILTNFLPQVWSACAEEQNILRLVVLQTLVPTR
eukprot:GABV01001965.1.p1 GENE.GABV01001965.1~~GABV01001965.1.p1  ORF type:complete len:182 (-),score=43.59 GABV01001965.1:83-628(-)